MLPFAFFGRQTLYCSEMVLLLCGSFQYNFVYWTTSRISEQLCFVKQQFSFVHIVFVGSTLTIYLKNEKYTLVGVNLSSVISLLVTRISYFGTGVEVKPGQTVSCGPGKGCILRISQVYPFPS